MRHFEESVAWQKSRELVKVVYESQKNNKDFGFRDQFQRAAISVMNNIAEGFERKGERELLRYLIIALGSCGEVRSMTYAGEDLQSLASEQSFRIRDLCWEVRKILLAFINKIRDDIDPQSGSRS